jgi:transcriptional regulator with XRE-family HTH domain
MNERLLAQEQKKRGLSDEELAYLVGRNVRTIRNLKCGNSSSVALRQRITNILRTKIWPDIDVTEKVFVFRPGTNLELSPVSFARGWARMFNRLQPGVAVRQGQTIRFVRPIAVTFEIEPPLPGAADRNRKISSTSLE